jgi:hypothetical protein
MNLRRVICAVAIACAGLAMNRAEAVTFDTTGTLNIGGQSYSLMNVEETLTFDVLGTIPNPNSIVFTMAINVAVPGALIPRPSDFAITANFRGDVNGSPSGATSTVCGANFCGIDQHPIGAFYSIPLNTIAIDLDPIFLVTNDLGLLPADTLASITYSIDVGLPAGTSVALTPIPASLWLYATGLGLLGFGAWRIKRPSDDFLRA